MLFRIGWYSSAVLVIAIENGQTASIREPYSRKSRRKSTHERCATCFDVDPTDNLLCDDTHH